MSLINRALLEFTSKLERLKLLLFTSDIMPLRQTYRSSVSRSRYCTLSMLMVPVTRWFLTVTLYTPVTLVPIASYWNHTHYLLNVTLYTRHIYPHRHCLLLEPQMLIITCHILHPSHSSRNHCLLLESHPLIIHPSHYKPITLYTCHIIHQSHYKFVTLYTRHTVKPSHYTPVTLYTSHIIHQSHYTPVTFIPTDTASYWDHT